MQFKRSMFWAVALIALFLLQGASPLVQQSGQPSQTMNDEHGIEWVQFDLREGTYLDAVGYEDFSSHAEERLEIAKSRIGTFDSVGFHVERPVPSEWMTPCLLYTSPSPRDGLLSRMPSSA